MIKRFTPLALLFGLLTALLLGGTATAQANPLPAFKCSNGAPVGVVVCVENVLNQVTITIRGNRALTDIGNDNEISVLEKSLNDVEVNVNPNTYLGNLEAKVVEVYNNKFDIDITVGDVDACIALLCK